MLIAGPNLTMDRTLTGGELRPGAVLRFAARVTPGGKGLNVARGVRALGGRAAVVGFVPGHTGAAAAAMVADEGLVLRGVSCAGELRSTSVILEPGGRSTVINEAGPEIGAGEWGRYEQAVAAGLDGEQVLVCSGSLPPGAPADAYARLCGLAHERGAFCIVDGSGSALAGALAARPDLICPNEGEAEAALAGGDHGPDAVDAAPDSRPHALAAAAALAQRGPRAVIVTAAAAGAAFARADEILWLAAPRVTVRNPVGAGDALVAGLAVALERGVPLLEAARAGMAAAAAGVEDERPGMLDPARAAELLAELGGATAPADRRR
jgi:1-phosphofructokinase family hexose kinase